MTVPPGVRVRKKLARPERAGEKFVRDADGCGQKVSGRWGFRPLGRGGLEGSNPKFSPSDPTGRLRSQAAVRRTGANK